MLALRDQRVNNMSELWEFGAAELSQLIQSKRASSLEVVTAHLDRIDAINPAVNAITVSLRESAIENAKAVDRSIAAHQNLGELAGIPITIKENQDLVGSATTLGLAPLKSAIAESNSPHIAELLDSGAIPIGRTNMPEFGMRWHTDNAIIGATRNPWDKSLTPGGSSGGEAAAIASGMSPLGIGNDGAGSLRWPAQCCGISALKPSHGRIPVSSTSKPLQPIPFAFQLLGVHGPMARCIEDLRLGFRHMCSNSAGDPWHVEAPFDGKEMKTPIRVGLVLNPGGAEPHPSIQKALRSAATRLVDAGYSVEEVEMPNLVRASEIYTQIMDSFGRLTPETQRAPVGVISQGFDDFWAGFHEAWEAARGKPTHDPMMERGVIANEWAAMMERTPLLLAPIAMQPAWKVGSDLEKKFNSEWLEAIRSIVAINLLGLPSVAFPAEMVDGLPQGVQIIGRRFREDLCLQAAESIEVRSQFSKPIKPID